MQDVRRRMIGARRRARIVIDLKLDPPGLACRALDDYDVMDDEIAKLLARVGDFGAKAGRGDFADIADLAAQFAIKRRLIEDERSAFALRSERPRPRP